MPVIREEIRGLLLHSIAQYESRVRGKPIRDIFLSEWEPPDLEFLRMSGAASDRATSDAVKFWNETMTDWRKKYGSIDGWNDFHNYWSVLSRLSSNSIAYASAEDAFKSYRFQSIRDFYGGGGTGRYDIYGR